jgi:hypothetical protein
MAINWPSIAQGTGTGTSYTAPSPGKNVWIWSGYSWGSTGTTANGGFNGPWVIFNSYGKSRAFNTLKDAIVIAASGDTIHLFQNITETLDSSEDYIIFDKNININLNGHTYTLNANSDINHVRGFTNIGDVNVKIFNGNILAINAPVNFSVFVEVDSISTSTGCNWTFNSVIITKNSGSSPVGSFISSVTGGIFKDTSATEGVSALALFPSLDGFRNSIIIRDCIGISNKGNGIYLSGGDPNLLITLINCKGYSSFASINEEWSGIHVINQGGAAVNGTNKLRLINCLGVNDYDIARFGLPSIGSYGISTSGLESTLIHCDGKAISGGGIKTDGSTLISCSGESRMVQTSGQSNSFYSLGSSVLKRCSASGDGTNGNNIALKTEGAIRYGSTGEYIDGCNLQSSDFSTVNSDASGIYVVSGSSANTIYISNSVVSGYNYGIVQAVASTPRINVYNSKITHTPSSIYGSHYPIVLNGELSVQYQVIANNTIESTAASPAIYRDSELFSLSIYMTHNSCRNVNSLNSTFGGVITQGMTSVIDTKMNIQQNINY